jgi:ABC-type siderophore export system fused ATPase/permease subunit
LYEAAMDNLIPIASTISVALATSFVMPRLVSGQRKRVAQIEPLLRERGGMTLNEIASELGTSVFAKGYLMQALDKMVADGTLIKVPPPKGHPRFRIFKDTKYLVASAT